MNRYLMAILLLLALTACGGGDDNNADAQTLMPVQCNANPETCR